MKQWFVKAVIPMTAIFLCLIAPQALMAQTRNLENFILRVVPMQQSYLPGEIVKLQIKATNTGKTSAAIEKTTNVLIGGVEIYVAKKDKNFEKYRGPGWDETEGFYPDNPYQEIEPGDSFISIANVLFNLYSHDITERSRGIKTWYAFPEPGEYYIKAILHDTETYKQSVESEPLKITISQPQGVDLQVWNAIKGNDDIASFLHTRDIDDEQEKIIKPKLEYLLNLYPTSFYAKYIRQAFEQAQNPKSSELTRAKETGFCVEKAVDEKSKCNL